MNKTQQNHPNLSLNRTVPHACVELSHQLSFLGTSFTSVLVRIITLKTKINNTPPGHEFLTHPGRCHHAVDALRTGKAVDS